MCVCVTIFFVSHTLCLPAALPTIFFALTSALVLAKKRAFFFVLGVYTYKASLLEEQSSGLGVLSYHTELASVLCVVVSTCIARLEGRNHRSLSGAHHQYIIPQSTRAPGPRPPSLINQPGDPGGCSDVFFSSYFCCLRQNFDTASGKKKSRTFRVPAKKDTSRFPASTADSTSTASPTCRQGMSPPTQYTGSIQNTHNRKKKGPLWGGGFRCF